MSSSFLYNGIVTFRDLVIQIASTFKDSGSFEVVRVDDTEPGNIDNIQEKIYLKATSTIDSIVSSQPWGIVLEFNESEQWMDIYIVTPEQIIVDPSNNNWRIALKKQEDSKSIASGKLTPGSVHFDSSRESEYRRTLDYEVWGLAGSDTQAYPFSLCFNQTNHGISVGIWSESADSDGDKFLWFVCQRMVTPAGVPVTTGKSPLFCVFSYNPSSSDGDAIQKFVVRESDVNAPTIPVTAVEDTADSNRIINNKQQVSIREGNEIVLTFPNGLCTQRYGYDTELDLVGIISSDVLSQSSTLTTNPYSESNERTYQGMTADKQYNAGMRVMFWTAGGD
tara:strand:+ start:39160 stop:40167 length:1008 start_codon:yes stop_codon:yes gene_type:complete